MGAEREVCTHSKSLAMPYLWLLLHPNCCLLGCCFLASSHFSLHLPSYLQHHLRQQGLAPVRCSPGGGWTGFPEPAVIYALLSRVSSELWEAEKSCKCRALAPCARTLGHSWATSPAQLPWGVFPVRPFCTSQPGIRQLLCSGGIQGCF